MKINEIVLESPYDFSLADYQKVAYDDHAAKSSPNLNPNIGPQEGKYLNLMLKKMKPITAIEPHQTVIRQQFQPYIDNKTFSLAYANPQGRWYVTLPGEEWRGKKLDDIWMKMAAMAKQGVKRNSQEFKLINAKIGRLLGIPKESVRWYLNNILNKS